jgi:phage head maturation protease
MGISTSSFGTLPSGTLPNISPHTLIAFGSGIKTLADSGDSLRIGGHLVLFGGPEAHDATPTRDYFTARTDFDIPPQGAQSTVYYHHGLNAALKARPLGRASLRIDEAGVWMEAELQARDAYEAKILEMVRRGKLGLSSGTAVHLVERAAKSNAQGQTVHEITRWPLGLDASLTPTPGEPRTMATALKFIGELKNWDDELDEVRAAQSEVQAALTRYFQREIQLYQ